MTEQNAPRLARRATRIAATAVFALVAALALALMATERADAQGPPATEEQAMSIERQLMCPQCPNERLDTCDRAVCQDMKRIIREQLADGRTPDDIILFFEMRYGPRVRASLPAEGFNLFLYGWIGAAMIAVAGGGTWYVWSVRRRTAAAAAQQSDHRPSAMSTDVDDAWLDEQLRSDEAER